MATKSCLIGPTREENGNQVVTFGFTYSELTQLSYSIDEHIGYWNMYTDNKDMHIVKEAFDAIDALTQLQHKVDAYRDHALRNREDDGQ